MNLLFTSVQDAWQLAGWTMILFLAAGTLWLVFAGAVRLLLRRANANLRYASSLLSFVALAIFPVIIVSTIVASRERQRPESTKKHTKDTKELLNAEVPMASRKRERPEIVTDLATEVTESTEKTGEITIAAIPRTPFDFESFLNQSIAYLPWVWIVGTPLTFLLLASGLIGAERLRRSCQLLSDGPINVACEELRTALKITRKVGVAICESISSPLVVGVVKPLILLPPAALTGWSPEHLEMVLVHELAHVRRWDNAVNLFQRIVESLLFFHPAVWIVSGWVRRDREDCCDAVVVRHTAKPQAYAELLLALASHQPLAVSAAMARHPVASRIRRILKLQDEPMLVSRHAIGFLVSAALACVLAVGFFAPSGAEEASRKRQRPEVSRESERSADERSEETTNQTNDTNRYGTNQDLATEDTESTKEDVNAEDAREAEDTKVILADIPDFFQGKISHQEIIKAIEAQGYEANISKVFRGDGKRIDRLSVVVPADADARIIWDETNKNRVSFPHVVLMGKALSPVDITTTQTNNTNQDLATESTEKEYLQLAQPLADGRVKFSFVVSPTQVDDPAQRATKEALMKSDLVLSLAIENIDISLPLVQEAKPTLKDWLARELVVEYTPKGTMLVSMSGKEQDKSQIEKIVRTIVAAYRDNIRRQKRLNAEGAEVKIARIYELDEHEAEIKNWLKAIDELSDEINLFTKDGKEMAVITGTQRGHDILVERLERIRGNTSNSLFPTLEEQRAADLAYKLLGVELENPSPGELEMVRFKGYQGGLRVTTQDNLARGLRSKDILVGLHVWPTKSLNQVMEILARGDLDELTPLKFYVVRQEPGENVVVTGRIDVDLDAWREMKEASRKVSTGNQETQSTLAVRRAAKQHEFAQKKYERALESNRQVAGSIPQSEIEELKLAAELAKIELERVTAPFVQSESDHVKQSGSQSRPRAEVIQERINALQLKAQNLSGEELGKTLAEIETWKQALKAPTPYIALDEEVLFFPVDPSKSNLSDSQKVAYDGKGFDEWRRMWRAELKTEKRIECIKALAAFSRVGMGQDAAEAVLDVAAEYDFGATSSSGPVLEFKKAIREVLTSGDGIPAEYWLPLLVERLEQDPDQWGPMAAWVLRDARSKNPEVLKLLIEIAGDKNFKSSLRRIALENIVTQLDSGNKEAEKVIRDALQNTDPMLAISALNRLAFSRFDQFPEQLELLFAEDSNVRRFAHTLLDRFMDDPHAELAVQKLFEIIDDPTRSKDHGLAFIAVCQIVRWHDQDVVFKKYIPEIHQRISRVFVDGDAELYPHVINALDRLSGPSWQSFVQELDLSDERIEELKAAQEAADQINVQRNKGNY